MRTDLSRENNFLGWDMGSELIIDISDSSI
jgi:hypothetical protein